MVEDGLFIERQQEIPRISYSKMHQLQIDANSPIKKSKGCGCKKGKCGENCGCKKNDMSCHSGCSCTGNCANYRWRGVDAKGLCQEQLAMLIDNLRMSTVNSGGISSSFIRCRQGLGGASLNSLTAMDGDLRPLFLGLCK